ncbi:MFS transporter [Rufibacter latericius]|nr:MFS transporter [Rufibacter latericius]
MAQLLSLYRNAFQGLSREAWLLAFVMFIKRSGAMVVPFLSVYLTESLGFSLPQVGVLMSLFGLGATVGNLLGGWLTDRWGYVKVQLLSFFLGGSWFLAMIWVQRFELLAGGLFLLSALTESLYPANSAAVSSFSSPESVTRAFSLNRMAMNLGFSIGPAIGGLLAMVSYQFLFLADGLTCFAAGAVFFLFFRNGPKNALPDAPPNHPSEPENSFSNVRSSAYRDPLFLVFAFLSCCYLVAFSQLFTTMPLYWHQVHHLSKFEIGALLAFDGLLVVSLEMVIVYWLGKVQGLWKMIVVGLFLLALALLALTLAQGFLILVVSVIFWSLSEILVLPFLSTLTAQRAGSQNLGSYMGLYTLSYSVAYIVGPLVGTNTIDQFGFDTLWWGCSALCILAAGGLYLVVRRLQAS